MILDENVLVMGNSKICNHYKSLGYDMIPGEKILVKIVDLSNGSHVKINVQCDICHSIKELNYEKY